MINITITYGLSSLTKEFDDLTTVGTVLGNPNLKAYFGWGDNLRALVHGVEQPSDARVSQGQTLVVETKSNTKSAPDVTFTVRFGLTSATRTLPGPLTIGQVQDDPNLRAVFGWGDNTRVLISGVEQPRDAGVPHGATLVFETRSNTKSN